MEPALNKADIEAKINQIKSFIEVDGTNPHLFINLGDLYHKISKNDEAEDCYLKSLKLSDSPVAQSRLGLVKISKHQFQDAENIFNKVIKTEEGESSTLIFNLALAQYHLMKWGRALKNFIKAMDNGVSETACLPHISRCYRHLYDFKSAKENCISWLDKTNSADAKGYLALLEMDSGNSAEANKLAYEVLKADPDNADAGIVIGTHLVEEHDILKARNQFNRIIKNENLNARALFGLGLTHMYEQEHAKALQYMEQGSSMIPNDTGMKVAIGWAKVNIQDLDGAEKVFMETIQINRKFPEGHGGLAYVLALKAKMHQAKESMEMAFSLDPDSFSASAAKSVIIGYEQNLDESTKYLSNVLESPQGPGQKSMMEHLEIYMKNHPPQKDKTDSE